MLATKSPYLPTLYAEPLPDPEVDLRGYLRETLRQRSAAWRMLT